MISFLNFQRNFELKEKVDPTAIFCRQSHNNKLLHYAFSVYALFIRTLDFT